MLNRNSSLALAIVMSFGTLGAAPPTTGSNGAPLLEEVVVHGTMLQPEAVDIDDYDPWEPFNEKMFKFNYRVDRFVLKPVAKVYNGIVLDGEKQAINNAYDNVAMPKRFINSLIQGKFKGAGLEFSRFLINSTLGFGGLADVAKYQFHMERSDENTGQTLGYYGVGPGPYLVLPFMPPLTVRDAVGYAFDVALDPISYALPLVGSVGKTTESVVNTRAGNIEKYENAEEAVLDLYSAVRNDYLAGVNSRSPKGVRSPRSAAK